ncbi:MAG: hypothetical protein QOI07_3311 [Verrucomicrobiota bacterium]|jgi:hypothetical protein
MRSLLLSVLVSATLITAELHAQQILSVGAATECKLGQGLFMNASTYHADPDCASWASAPGGGCTQWHLFLNGQMIQSKITVPAAGSTQTSNPPLDFYTYGRFLLTQSGQYQIKMSYSRVVCSGWWIFQTCNHPVYVNETPILTVTASDLNPANWNQCPIGSFDGANCFVMAKPPNGFIWNQGFYGRATKTANCAAGSFDGQNCFIMPKPANGFIWNNGFYAHAGPGAVCSVGTYDGANCFILNAPWGTTAFEFAGNFYVSPISVCSQGSFDGANCLLATAPAGTTLFDWEGGFYIKPLHPCSP